MRALRCFALILACFLAAAPLRAQKQKREPLTDAQVEEIREAGIDPAERIKLYAKYIDEHVDTIKKLTNRSRSDARARRLDNELLDLAALMDEMGENLDQYADRKADLRKALKPLSEAAPRWLNTLRALAGEPPFDLSRKEAIESGDDLADQATRLLQEQTDYFNQHKDEAGQQRAEPK